jgi:D-xylose transport system ATP-binding protein
MPLLELSSITKEFPGVRALDHVSFELEKGEVHALCGENGAGKSTLIKVLSGLYPQGTYEGTIRLRGEVLHLTGVRDAERRGIAVIAQELALVPEMTVAENLMLGREPVSRGLIQWDRLRAEAREALALVGSSLDPATPVRALGVAQQQMIEIARALAKRSEILVLDEPTAALTESDARRLLDLVRDLRRRGVSSIYISHRLEEVFSIADRITVLRDGHTVRTAPARDWTPDCVIAAMVGREVRNLYPRPKSVTGKPALEIADWRVEDPANPGRLVLDGVSFAVHEGEVLGIAGLMGSGRTALVSSFFGLARGAVSGTLHVPGRASRKPFRNPAEAIEAGLALAGEDRKRHGVVSGASVLENLTLPTLGRFRRGALLDDGARTRASQDQVESLSIKTPSLDAPAGNLSGGTQQKVVLGKWLMAKPKVLLLDEPTRGIDAAAKDLLIANLRRRAEAGASVVIASRKMENLKATADEFSSLPGKVVPIECHVGRKDQLENLVATIEKQLGAVDILVNNSATNIGQGPALEVTDEMVDKMVDVNIKAALRLIRLTVPKMIERKTGSIINIASIAGLRPQAGGLLYSFTKAGLIMMTRTWAVEFGQKGVRVNAIAPGLIQTDFSEFFWKNEQYRSKLEKTQPINHVGQPDEIGFAALYLASDEASYVTGQVIVIDGGATAM